MGESRNPIFFTTITCSKQLVYKVICVPCWRPTEIVAGQMEKAWNLRGDFCGKVAKKFPAVTNQRCLGDSLDYSFLSLGVLLIPHAPRWQVSMSHNFWLVLWNHMSFPMNNWPFHGGHWCVYLGGTNPKGIRLGIYSHIWLLPVLIP